MIGAKDVAEREAVDYLFFDAIKFIFQVAVQMFTLWFVLTISCRR